METCFVKFVLLLAVVTTQVLTYSIKLTDKPDQSCKGKKDGDYVISDVFSYLHCQNSKGQIKHCGKNEIFSAETKKCEDSKNYNYTNFCVHRTVTLTGNYRNPWDCHGFIICLFGISYKINCAHYETFVYDPYKNQCLPPSKGILCQQVPSFVIEKHSTVPATCDGQPDGIYPIADIFKYMECASGTASFKECPKASIYEPGQKECVPISAQSQERFCENRTIGDWQDPWNCHGLFKCEQGVSHFVPCQLPNLVFDPYLDQCVYPSKYACHQVPQNYIVTSDNPCESKGDGSYSIPDVFGYLQCKDHVAKYGTCPDIEVFDEKQGKCIDSSSLSKKTFCDDRSTGNYRDPWACHNFITCVHGKFIELPCAQAELVYNPYHDRCEFESKFKCKELKKQNDLVTAENPCESKGDGSYAIPDVFGYLQCKDHVAKYSTCPDTDVFDEKQGKCVDSSSLSKKTFCDDRNTGNYRDPWDCHSFISCVHGTFIERHCAEKDLVYDPYDDRCGYEIKFKCKELKKQSDLVTAENPCESKGDGSYAIPDVFGYLQCKDHVAKYGTCPDTDVFDEKQGKCVDSSSLSKKTFCNDRNTGNYRDPWDCHSFISCVHGTFIERHCAEKDLVYDPYDDRCGYEIKFKCKELKKQNDLVTAKNPCESKGDGSYGIPDVFSYLQCKEHIAKYVACPGTDVFDEKQRKCVGSSSLSKETFCDDRTTRHYRDPWDCHSYISCVHGAFHERPCAEKDLVYDPYNGLCEYESKFPCKEFELTTNPCGTKADGTYAIPDIFKYMICKNHKVSYGSCPESEIYSPAIKNCIDIGKVSYDNFCVGRDDGDWANPFSCLGYILCDKRVAKARPCLINGFVFNPYLDVCVKPGDYPCKQASNSDYDSRIRMAEDPCKDKDDGQYVVADMFSYLTCKNREGKIYECKENFVYDKSQKKCVDGSPSSLKTFCKGKNDGNYQNLWNCHSFVSCVSEMYYVQPCPESLVYDPYFKRCETLSSFRCRELDSGHHVDKECKDKDDGLYPTKDLFKYLQCTLNQGTYHKCPPNHVFDSEEHKCIDGKSISKHTFCDNKKDGNYQNPWDCHSYISCVATRFIERPCAIESLVYNPYSDACEYSGEYECNQIGGLSTGFDEIHANCTYTPGFLNINNRCEGQPDGKYPVSDVFKYILCKSGKESTIFCDPNKIFAPHYNDCIEPKAYNITADNFCKYRCNGKFQDPWNCRDFFTCFQGRTSKFPCAPPPVILAYDGDIFQCADIACQQLPTAANFCQYRCNGKFQHPWKCHYFISCFLGRSYSFPCAPPPVILVYNGDVEYCQDINCHQLPLADEVLSLSTTASIEIKDICTTLPDDYYATRNVLQILQCKNHTSVNIDCPDGQIYVPGNGPNCTDAAKISQENFCVDRSDGNWQDPFNCHAWYTCHAGITYNRPCSLFTILNYDPVNDLCEYPSVYPCKNVTTKRHYHRSEDDTKLEQIKMLPAKKVNSELVGKQIENEQEKEDIKDVTKIKITPSNDDPCADLPDGKYAVADVGVIMICCHHVRTYQKCPPGQIYLPGQEECSPLKDITKEAFCKGRKDGNWRNPWDCHDYITCHAGYSFDRPCSIKTILNFNPYKNLCEYPRDYPCENITSVAGQDEENRKKTNAKVTDKIKFIPSNKDDKTKVRITDKIKFIPSSEEPCATLIDGKYAVRDVGVILTCHNHVHTYEKCPSGQIYVPGKDKCTPLKYIMKAAFCKGRKDGNWRNPWNCHRYITCFAGYSFDRPCSIKTTLNYNPYDDLCEYPYDYKCKNISAIFDQSKAKKEKTKVTDKIETVPSGEEPCAILSDGNYAVADVGVVLICHNHVHTYKKCAAGQIYVPSQGECSPLKDIRKGDFCKGRKDGNWRNPWNCHDYITCHAGYFFDRPCSIKTTLNYNPYDNLCEYPYDYKCENITTTAERRVFGTFDIVV